MIPDIQSKLMVAQAKGDKAGNLHEKTSNSKKFLTLSLWRLFLIAIKVRGRML
jgi:hypothetical protein